MIRVGLSFIQKKRERNVFLYTQYRNQIVELIYQADLAASTQAAIVEVLVKKSISAVSQSGLKRLVVAGGVGANALLRSQLNEACGQRGIRVHYPELHLCTDNGAMIALAAGMRLQAGLESAQRGYTFDVKPRWNLSEIAL